MPGSLPDVSDTEMKKRQSKLSKSRQFLNSAQASAWPVCQCARVSLSWSRGETMASEHYTYIVLAFHVLGIVVTR